MKRLRLLFGFLCAVLRAAPHAKRIPNPLQIVKAIGVVFWIGRTVNPAVEQARMDCCRRCPNFSHYSETCGVPPSDYGCWCYMPLKAKLPEARCWLSEVNPDHPPSLGWPNHLNGQ
jgi:hypothetical protein